MHTFDSENQKVRPEMGDQVLDVERRDKFVTVLYNQAPRLEGVRKGGGIPSLILDLGIRRS
jgi:hypothetical protein